MSAGTGRVRGFIGRLYRGDTNINFIASRKKWYAASALIILICVASMIFRGFNLGIDFRGGDSYQLPIKPGVTLADVRNAVNNAGVEVETAQTAGSGARANFVIKTKTQPTSAAELATVDRVRTNLAAAGKVDINSVSASTVSKSWGSTVTSQAIRALIVFLFAVTAFIWLRFQEWRMSLAALLALFHDLLLTAGVYALVGFEVTPSTVVGLLTILGFSLYDTVVVFDKVSENSRGLLSSTRYTYPEAANMAVNQTLMRSINTSLIGLLPVAGLLFVGAGILGVGTLEDLALVLFVGMLTGAYSSLFLATPWLVDFKLMDPRFKNQQQRVISRRTAQRKAETEDAVPRRRAAAAATAATAVTAADEAVDAEIVAEDRQGALASTAAPRVGAKPAPKRGAGQRPGANRPRPGAKRR